MPTWLWLAVVWLILAALPVLALASPIEVALVASYPGQPRLKARVRWLWGLFHLDGLGPTPSPAPGGEAETAGEVDDDVDEPAADPPAGPKPAGREEDEPPEEELASTLDAGIQAVETRREIEQKALMALAALRTRDFPLQIARLLRDLVRSVNVERIGLKAGFGLGSPAKTGRVFGQLQVALAWTRATDRVHVDLDPDFEAQGITGQADLAVRSSAWALICPLVAFLLAPPTIRAVKNARGATGD